LSADTASFRERLGCWLHERPRTELALAFPALARRLGSEWLDLRNRRERLRVDGASGGRSCEWKDSSRLTVARVFPRVGPRLLRRALAQWPLALPPDYADLSGASPEVSILLPVSGLGREAQFRLALAAARAQQGVLSEVIFVDLSPRPEFAERLPAGVRYHHEASVEGIPFNKCRALNLGAQLARGQVLLLLDADMLVPARYAAECARVLREVEAARPARFLFCLDAESTQRSTQDGRLDETPGLESIIANTPMPLAVRADTYRDIGGHDESYAGWGGEDSEFLDRLRTRSLSEGGWMPVLHLWHAPAAGKQGERNRAHHRERMSVPALERIERLRASGENRT
jgi:hypothetical protein